MNRKQIQSNLMLVLVALIWGTAFVFQAMGGDTMSAYAFNALRSLAAGIALLPLIAFNNAKQKKSGRAAEAYPKDRRTLIVGGIVVGAALAVASALQQQHRVHHGGQGGLYNGNVHSIRAGVRNIPAAQAARYGMDKRGAGRGWALFPIDERQLHAAKRAMR